MTAVEAPAQTGANTVVLHVYDLSRGMARVMSQPLLGFTIDIIPHTGLVVYGREYFFSGGIVSEGVDAFAAAYGLPVHQRIELGTSEVPRMLFEEFLEGITHKYTAAKYDLATNNCNHFSNEAAEFLLGRGIPDEIVGLPQRLLATPVGQAVAPMLQAMQDPLQFRGTPGSAGGAPSLLPTLPAAPAPQPPLAQPTHTSAAPVAAGVLKAADAMAWQRILSAAAAGGRTVIADFYADWCGPCRRIAPAVEALSREFKHVVFVKVDVDRNQEIASRCGVSSMPTFKAFVDGREVGQMRGASAPALRAFVLQHARTPKPDGAVVLALEQLRETDVPAAVEERCARISDVANRLPRAADGSAPPPLELLAKLLSNVLASPSELKFRRVRLSNAKISSVLTPHKPAMQLLRLIGFTAADGDGVEMSDEVAADVTSLRAVLAALELAKANQRPTPASTGASTQERGQSSTQPCAAEQPSPAVTPSVPEDPATPPTERIGETEQPRSSAAPMPAPLADEPISKAEPVAMTPRAAGDADGAAVVGSEAALLATPAATSVKPVTSAKLASQPQVARPLLSLGGQTGAALKKLRSDIEAYVGKMPEGKAQQKRALLAITSATHAHVLSEQGLAAPAELPAAAAADLGGAWATLLEEWPPTQQFLLLFLARFLVGSAAFTNAWLAAGAARSLLDGCLKEQAGTPNPGRAARLMGLTTLANLAASEEAVAALLALAPAEASELIERSFSLLGGADADAALLAAALLHNLCLGFPNHAELSGPVLESQLLLISGLLPALSEQVSPAASQRLLVALGALLARGGDECVGTAQALGADDATVSAALAALGEGADREVAAQTPA
eukprot:CAMPEP_0119362584 /NCGR_PEP_ID=MMETSP1334-20130426/9598_1 /TAXON_ID=127549 /ORGANISM="Calcidiscus leptoporus, Strain RCC1130" /LENGTH=848 /DNA_ID=CAMNT_0007377811 /DNA_START=11 /DNA_END=2557 /DNA_ORIENTATION=-